MHEDWELKTPHLKNIWGRAKLITWHHARLDEVLWPAKRVYQIIDTITLTVGLCQHMQCKIWQHSWNRCCNLNHFIWIILFYFWTILYYYVAVLFSWWIAVDTFWAACPERCLGAVCTLLLEREVSRWWARQRCSLLPRCQLQVCNEAPPKAVLGLYTKLWRLFHCHSMASKEIWKSCSKTNQYIFFNKYVRSSCCAAIDVACQTLQVWSVSCPMWQQLQYCYHYCHVIPLPPISTTLTRQEGSGLSYLPTKVQWICFQSCLFVRVLCFSKLHTQVWSDLDHAHKPYKFLNQCRILFHFQRRTWRILRNSQAYMQFDI